MIIISDGNGRITINGTAPPESASSCPSNSSAVYAPERLTTLLVLLPDEQETDGALPGQSGRGKGQGTRSPTCGPSPSARRASPLTPRHARPRSVTGCLSHKRDGKRRKRLPSHCCSHIRSARFQSINMRRSSLEIKKELPQSCVFAGVLEKSFWAI